MSCTFAAPPGTAATIRVDLRLRQLHQRQHLRRDRRRSPPGSGSAAPPPRARRRPPPRPAPPASGVANSARTSARSPRRRIRSDQRDRQQRVAAELEEVVVPADPLHAQHLRPDRRQRLLDLAVAAPRSRVAHTASPSGAGSALRSSLPFGVSGSASSAHERRRHHVLRQAPPQVRRAARSASAPPRRPRTPPAACRPARPRAPRPPHRATPALRRSTRLDLAQLDPEAPDLHLVVVRPRNSSVPSARQRARSPVRYSRAPPSRRERIGDEALRRQLAARPR